MYKYNNTKNAAVILAAAIATAIVMGPIINNIGEVLAKQKYDDWDDCRDDHSKNWCKKYFKHHHDNDDDYDDDGNRASQGIGQSQSSSQNSQVVSGGDSIGSGNNFSFQNQVNTGNNALAQDDDDDDDGNRASQGIGQSQSSSQNSQVVSGGDSIGSGNNFSFQNQVNTGNNALAQQ
ncbi:hypothetical protein [Candidatus Nitrosocosmicus sp. SS]|jgi:hypothetical protein|uniref:hypothetical protein n=1 Tax=Candidatus Nitrosocosmicus agrestis TaxID=2563600 RepID=UPI00122DEB5E|nr:hypothetical protein [Candidatus Nitrosocosmicus sp. SS]KAA2283387.1 hypothetical protein F1Z66_02520 [Candidatus Nitrosocosmicus sp. SS]KAF0868967.1 hypothetical protein E5N71_08210 [Candidatus Nitrosocosmicus sp. SS]